MQIAGQRAVDSEGFLLDAMHQLEPLEQWHEVALDRLREAVLVGEHQADWVYVDWPVWMILDLVKNRLEIVCGILF